MKIIEENVLFDLSKNESSKLKKIISNNKYSEEYLKDSIYGRYYRNYLVVTHFRELNSEKIEFSDEVLLYNKYYWFSLFVRLYKQLNNNDDVLDELLFRIIEEIDHRIENVNWEWMKQMDEMVKKQSDDYGA